MVTFRVIPKNYVLIGEMAFPREAVEYLKGIKTFEELQERIRSIWKQTALKHQHKVKNNGGR